MNVLFVLARYPGYGGIEKVTTILCNSLCDSIAWVGIYSFEQQCENDLLLELNSKVHFIKSDEPCRIYAKRNVQQLNALIRKASIDIIVYQDSYAPYFKTVASAIKKTRVKLVVVEHNTPEQSLRTNLILDVIKENQKSNVIQSILAYYKGRYFQYSQHIYKYIKCDKYVLLSDRFFPSFRKLVPFASEKKLMAINNPNSVTFVPNNSEKQKCCLFCARLEPQKGIDYLMNIWTIIESKRKDWKLVIVGNGSEYSKIQEIIAGRNLTNVVLEGYKQNTSKYYSQALLFLMTSRYEGWGMTIVEAKSHGCVPIAFNSYAAVAEVINDQEDGILVHPFDVNEYAHNVLSLMDDPQKISSLSKNAIDDSRRFSIDTIRKEWIGLFDMLLKKY